jgi:hypothetical protein
MNQKHAYVQLWYPAILASIFREEGDFYGVKGQTDVSSRKNILSESLLGMLYFPIQTF